MALVEAAVVTGGDKEEKRAQTGTRCAEQCKRGMFFQVISNLLPVLFFHHCQKITQFFSQDSKQFISETPAKFIDFEQFPSIL